MSPTFLALLILVFLVIWTTGSFFYWRISRQTKVDASQKRVQPAIRLAEQWLSDSQKKMEELVERSEQPLGAAQHELLELRLEAGRLPQGVKNMRLVRESFLGPLSPAALSQNLGEIAGLYLDDSDYVMVEPSQVLLRTSLGEMPCWEIEEGNASLSDDRMKALLSQAGRILSRPETQSAAGGFLFFKSERDYHACQSNPGWMEGLKAHRLMIMDLRGLTALLLALRLTKDAQRVLQTFEAGVKTTLGLAGQSDKMNEALSRLGAQSLKGRAILEGTPPSDMKSRT